MNVIRTEEHTDYPSPSPAHADYPSLSPDREKQDQIIGKALEILYSRLRQPGEAITSPKTAADFLKLELSLREQEVFACLFLDNKHRVIEYKELFFGTIDEAIIYPREVAKVSLRLNAAAVILAHNHPSGDTTPSKADVNITRKLKDALGLINVRMLDHIIVGGVDAYSLAEHGQV